MTPGIRIDVSLRIILKFKGGDLRTSSATVSNLRCPGHEQRTSTFILGYRHYKNMHQYQPVQYFIIVTENKLGHWDTIFEENCDNPPKSSNHVT